MIRAVAGQFRFQGELYSILAFAVRTSRASARTAFALTAHPELRVVTDCSIPPSSAERVSRGLNFEVEMRNVEPSEPLN